MFLRYSEWLAHTTRQRRTRHPKATAKADPRHAPVGASGRGPGCGKWAGLENIRTWSSPSNNPRPPDRWRDQDKSLAEWDYETFRAWVGPFGGEYDKARS